MNAAGKPDPDEAVSEAEFKSAMRQVAASVAIVTARHKGVREGLIATAVCSLSAQPPVMLVSMNHDAPLIRLVRESGAFAINFLADHQHAIGRLFSMPGRNRKERFSAGRWTMLQTQSPVLDGAVASFDCRATSDFSSGTHHVQMGSVIGVTWLSQDGLVYRDGSFRRLEAS